MSEMRHAVITGGEGGLANAMAETLAAGGYQVHAPGRQALDVTSPASVRDFLENRPVDLLVCCAGMTADALLAQMSSSAWNALWETNYVGARACATAVLPGMIARKSGHIIFVSSRSAIHPPAGQAAYAAAKAALLGLTTDLATRHGASGIRVNAILPGFLETGMTRAVPEKRRVKVLSDHALGRFNTPQAVAGFLRYLDEHLPWTSGQVFQLDSRPCA